MAHQMSDYVKEYRAAERELAKDKRSGKVEASIRFGNNRTLFESAANVALRAMPPREREKYELGYGPSGRRALNDPVIIEGLARRAVGPIPKSKFEIQNELELLRYGLRQKNPSDHFHNPARQLRMLLLVQALNGTGIDG